MIVHFTRTGAITQYLFCAPLLSRLFVSFYEYLYFHKTNVLCRFIILCDIYLYICFRGTHGRIAYTATYVVLFK